MTFMHHVWTNWHLISSKESLHQPRLCKHKLQKEPGPKLINQVLADRNGHVCKKRCMRPSGTHLRICDGTGGINHPWTCKTKQFNKEIAYCPVGRNDSVKSTLIPQYTPLSLRCWQQHSYITYRLQLLMWLVASWPGLTNGCRRHHVAHKDQRTV